MPWFHFRQNNSGGRWTGPAEDVFIQASNAYSANQVALKHGIYFDERDDCIACCGYRWNRVYDNEAMEKPLKHDSPPDKHDLVIYSIEPDDILKELL